MNILVIDAGTSSIRGILYNKCGKSLFCHQIPYEVRFKGSVLAEQDASDWSRTIAEIAAETVKYCEKAAVSCDALALTSQRSSVIPVDKNGEPLSPAIMWQDKRNQEIVEEFRPMENLIHELTGARINTVFSGTKMTWIRRMEPEIYRRTHKFCTIADFITHEITGEYRTDHTYGSRSLLMNVRSRSWDARLLDIFEVNEEKLCELVEPGTVIGCVTEEFSKKTGLKTGLPLVSAGGDQQCAAVGHGVIGAGSLEITTGTGAFMLGYSEKVPDSLKNNVICGAHAIPGKYVLESSMLTCAALYNWTKKTLFADSEEESFTSVNEAVEASPAGANGCIVLPYFQGRGTPDWNAGASGCFADISLGTTRNDMARAVLEAIALEAKNNLDILEGYAGKLERIRIGGGLTRFAAFNQIQADIYQKRLIHNMGNGEQTALGAWAGASVALKLYPDYDTALRQILSEDEQEAFSPNPARRQLYQEKQRRMNELYRQMYGGEYIFEREKLKNAAQGHCSEA